MLSLIIKKDRLKKKTKDRQIQIRTRWVIVPLPWTLLRLLLKDSVSLWCPHRDADK